MFHPLGHSLDRVKGHTRPFVVIVRVCVFLILLIETVPAAPNLEPPRILIINSYHYGYAWSDEEADGVLDGLRQKWPSLNIDIEYLDAKRRQDAENPGQMADIIRGRHGHTRFDIVITTDNPALEFAMNQRELLKEAPVVFCGLNDFTPDMLRGATNVTGLVELIDVDGAIDLATEILPDLRGMYVIHDSTTAGLDTQKLIEKSVSVHTNRLSFKYAGVKTIEEILQEIDQLDEHWGIMYAGMIRDSAGVVLPSFSDMEERVTSRSDAPFFYMSGAATGLGRSANEYRTGKYHGLAAAERAVRILEGEPASSIPITTKPFGNVTAEYSDLKRLGIALSRVPSHVKIVRAPEPLLIKYRNFALMSGGSAAACLVLLALLYRAHQQRRIIVEHALDGIFICDRQGRFLEANAAGLKMFQMKALDLKSEISLQSLVMDDRELRSDLTLDSRFHEGSFISIKMKRLEDIAPFDAEISTTPLPGDRMLGIIRDVTQRRLAEREVLRSKNRLQQISDLCPAFMFAKNHLGQFIFVSQKFANAHGLTVEEMMGRTTLEVTPNSEQALRYHQDDLKVMQSGTSMKIIEETFTDTHGDTRTYQTSKMPFIVEGTDEMAILGVSSDITEIKATRDQVRLLNDELETRVERRTAALKIANQELEAFSYSVSHDLRSPLRAISGFAEILSETHADRLDDEGKHHLGRIVAGASHMANLIDDILKLSRVSQSPLNLRQCHLSEIAREIAEELRHGDPEPIVTIHIEDVPPAMGDQQLLRVALANLLENAWKYTRSAGSPSIEFGCDTLDGVSTYFVKDNGAGFDMQYASKLFSPFTRLHTAEEFPGTGIGLATVQRVIRRHGGRIWATAEVDKGATFHFTIGKTVEQD